MPCELGKFIKKLKDLNDDELHNDYGFDSQKDFEQIIAQSITELSTQVFTLLCYKRFVTKQREVVHTYSWNLKVSPYLKSFIYFVSQFTILFPQTPYYLYKHITHEHNSKNTPHPTIYTFLSVKRKFSILIDPFV